MIVESSNSGEKVLFVVVIYLVEWSRFRSQSSTMVQCC